mmetsp:Transcript_22445/g.36938  ORF Transcript_22445/g.36938 Transcript_22445/m.36938 type:complete len:107 (+) Transcript_22445:97-417(+)
MKNDLFHSVESQLGVFGGADDEKAIIDHTFCKMIATKVQESDFPADCKQFGDAVSILKRHNTSNTNPYAGMSPLDAIDAKRAKDEGHLNNAQIKRRMTTKKNGRFY